MLHTIEENGEEDMEHAYKACASYTNSAEEDDGKNKKKMLNAKQTKTTDLLIWTDDEVGLLLRVSLDYKINKIQEGVDWETCKSKYKDITLFFYICNG